MIALIFSLFPLTAAAQGAANEVYLDDREPHAWSYYSDPHCLVRSLNPADVKITYFGYGTNIMYSSTAATPTGAPDVSVASDKVGIGIDAPGKNTYVYLKTLERVNGEQAASAAAADGPCFYRLIPNPYSLRPTHGTGDTRWRGFYKWRLKRLAGGSVYMDTAMTQPVAVGAMLDAEDTVYFMPTAEYGMEVDFEAIWARAFVYPTLLALDSASTAGTYATGVNAYERNFVIHTNDSSSRWVRNNTGLVKDFTLTAVYPNGTNGTSSTLLSDVPATPNMFLSASWRASGKNFFFPWETIKLEYLRLSVPITWTTDEGNSKVSLRGGQLICGRMCLPEVGYNYFLFDQSHNVVGINHYQQTDPRMKNIKWRLESGQFASFISLVQYNLNDNQTYVMQVEGRLRLDVTFGSDYDRSLGDNSKLRIPTINTCQAQHIFTSAENKNSRMFNYVVKSGELGGVARNNGAGFSLMLWPSAYPDQLRYVGARTLTVEGGIMSEISMGMETLPTSPEAWTDTFLTQVRVYMKGGLVRKSAWGGGNNGTGRGIRRMVFTGGEINGWITGGVNGFSTYGGWQVGDINLYFGGHARLQHTGSDGEFWGSYGGNLFAASSGYDINNSRWWAGNTYTVVADSAYISRNVYGGGDKGYAKGTSNIQILGGTIAGKVFGGSNKQKGGAVNIEMRGGHVIGGIHGGSNVQGAVAGPISVRVEGGTVGSPGCHDTVGNVFGCGYGIGTSVRGDVNVIIGREESKHPHVDNPIIHSNVYGGGFQGTYNATGHTLKVTTHNGRIKKSIFGGGYGTTAVITGNTNVNVLGTTHVEGNIYGGGNMGKVAGNTRVTIGE